ncbi:aldehyde ferredoxin oxidoreductase C-terminal domain-containing protein [Sedimentibacter sp.]|uniref:aldehyde ferredoxin oxidoreductase C-terminal domain-containing protein n=1 Tax=Sedimentibacter sp. TaxID=1960295 RepID=UPI00289996E9|nr:aldehyde ferredoxin oxidoreductase C-terminal domain-containing protein [Sedimentibacter sp.]
MSSIIRVNMTTHEIKSEINKDYEFLGGRSLSSRIVYDEVEPTCEPLGRKNKLVIAMGLLSGTIASSASRISIGAKSPLTNGIKETNCGGVAGGKLSKCGVQAIIIEGKSEDDKCYVLVINKDGYKLEVMNELKYLGNYDTVENLYNKYGRKTGILCVGPTGERGLRGACIASSDSIGELKFAARGGLGAVMGSKGLKAIVVDDKGCNLITYKDKEKFIELAKDYNKKLASDPKVTGTYHNYGTTAIVKAVNGMGALPTCNFRYGSTEHVSDLSGEKMNELILSRGGEGKLALSCMEICAIRCSTIYPDKDGKKLVSTMQYENIALLGSNLGMKNLDQVAQLNYEINNLGLDTIETGCALGVALDMGYGRFGCIEDCMALINEISRNTPLGRLIGNGALLTGQILGCDRIPTGKGQGFAGYDPRALKGNGVTYSMSTMGGDHTAGNCFGSRATVDPLGAESQGELSRTLQIQIGTLDCIGLCMFARGPLFADASILANIVNYRSGSSFGKDTIWELGIETLKLEREFNIKAGVSPAHDKLPEYLYEEPLSPTNAVFDLTEEEMLKAIV